MNRGRWGVTIGRHGTLWCRRLACHEVMQAERLHHNL